jgi:hypothetical protein
MNTAELKQCTACRRSYIVHAPLDYIDSGLCTPCEDEWFDKNVGADGGIFVNKVIQSGQWGAFLGLMIVLTAGAFFSYGVYGFVNWLRR